MRIVKIGTVDITDLDAKDARDSWPIQARNPLVSLRNGAYDHDGDTVVYQPTSVTRSILIAGDNIAEQIDRLKGLLGQRTVMIVELRDDRQRATYVKLDSASFQEDALHYDQFVTVQLGFSRAYPFFWDADQVDFFDTGLYLDSGLTFDGTYQTEVIDASPYTFDLNPAYNGTSRGRMLTLTFVPRAASSIAGITFKNTVNGMVWQYNGTVAAETRLDVDNMTQIVMNNSTDDWDNFVIPDARQLEIMNLEPTPGNNFEVTATITGTVDLYLRWIGEFL